MSLRSISLHAPRIAELISTGAELLNGRSVNRHARTLGERLGPLGIRIVRDTTVPDDLEQLTDALNGALDRVDLVFVTGGLGPTEDDLTRDAVAGVLGRRVIMSEDALRHVRERYQKYGRAMGPAGERQAQIVEGAEPLPNRIGAAPGERIEAGGKTLFLLPGPPAELETLLEDHVLPWLRNTLRGVAEGIPDQTYIVCGLGESDIVNRFEQDGFPPPGIAVAYCASAGRVEIRLSPGEPRAPSASGATAPSDIRWEAIRARIRELLGENLVAEERIDMQEVIGRQLQEVGRTLATAESCTGGMLGERITSVSGSSAWYRGGLIAYADTMKIEWLGVSKKDVEREGAVSETVAQQMARGVRERFGADYGIGITGIAGPAGGTPQKPVGRVYIACADAGRAIVKSFDFPGNRTLIRERSCAAAMDMLRRFMMKREERTTDGRG